MDTGELRVPTVPVEVTLVLAEGRRETVMVYLSAGSRAHEGPESLLEFLNRAGAFVPVRIQSGDSALVARDAIRSVIAARDAAVHEAAGVPSLDLVRVQLADGAEIDGIVRRVDPDDRARLSDHFNHPERFFAIESGDTIHYVNKQHVLFVL